jgi:hypothetical protein
VHAHDVVTRLQLDRDLRLLRHDRERWTKVKGSELDLYYVVSTWNPYVVVLMKSRLEVESTR